MCVNVDNHVPCITLNSFQSVITVAEATKELVLGMRSVH